MVPAKYSIKLRKIKQKVKGIVNTAKIKESLCTFVLNIK